MEILPVRDLIYDERGNYYACLENTGTKLILLNAYVNIAYNRIYQGVDEEFKHSYLGKSITKVLNNHLWSLKREETPGKIYSLDEVSKQYAIEFIDTAEYTK